MLRNLQIKFSGSQGRISCDKTAPASKPDFHRRGAETRSKNLYDPLRVSAPLRLICLECCVYLFPAIDLREGKVVRLLKGDYARQTTYGDDPVAFAKAFERAGATWLHVVNLDGARSGVPGHLEEVEAIRRNTRLK